MEEENIVNEDDVQNSEEFSEGFMNDSEGESEEQKDENDLDDDKVEQKPKNRTNHMKHEMSKLQRSRYKALHDVDVYKKENEKLKKDLEEVQRLNKLTSDAASAHYDDSINYRIKIAKERYQKAIDEADSISQTEAIDELTNLRALAVRSEEWKSQQAYHQQYQNTNEKPIQKSEMNYQDDSPPLEMNRETRVWLQRNPWANQQSPEYDKEMAEEVSSYANTLDNKFRRSGKEHKIMSKEYFNLIDQYVSKEIYNYEEEEEVYDEEPEQYVQKPRNLIMKNSRPNVAPVSRSNSSSSSNARSNNPKKIILSADQKEFVRSMNLTEDQYIAAIERDKILQKAKGKYYE